LSRQSAFRSYTLFRKPDDKVTNKSKSCMFCRRATNDDLKLLLKDISTFPGSALASHSRSFKVKGEEYCCAYFTAHRSFKDL